MTRYRPFVVVEELESFLGDPHDDDVAFSYARCVELDEREEFPDRVCLRLEAWGVHRFYVPTEFGGRLDSYEQGVHLLRVIARRDLTVAIGHGKTFLGAVSAWVGADEGQAWEIAREVLRATPISWGLTERDHGSDLLSGEVRAVHDGDHYRISGEKWLINNATRGRMTALLTRTDPAGGPRGFDVIFVDKAALATGAYRCLPKVPTHGIRGADISGIAYDDVVVPASARVGAPGAGLEIVLRGLQLTRTMCAGLALGGGDHALRIAARTLADRAASEPAAPDSAMALERLLDAYVDQLCNEIVAVTAARCIHHTPGEMSVVSAVAKYLVSVRTDAAIRSLGNLLGLQALVSDGPPGWAFEKVARDCRIVDLFDGNRIVNLHAIVNQFPLLAAAWARPLGWTDVRPLYDLTEHVPAFDRGGLRLVSKNGVSAVRALPGLAAEVERLARVRPGLDTLRTLVTQLLDRVAQLHERMAALPPARVEVRVGHFRVADEFAFAFAGAAVLGTWLGTRESDMVAVDDSGWRDGVWLTVALRRILAALGVRTPRDDRAAEAVYAGLIEQHRTAMLFSLWPCRLAEGGTA